MPYFTAGQRTHEAAHAILIFSRMRKTFYGWWIRLAAFLTFGISVGLPYYNMPFFYDYYKNAFNWPLHDITLGFPLAALLTLWVGPVLVPRFSPRKLIVAGTVLTSCRVLRLQPDDRQHLPFITSSGSCTRSAIFFPARFRIRSSFRTGSGESRHGHGDRVCGGGLVGARGPWLIKPLTEQYSFRTALLVVGCVMFAGVAVCAVCAEGPAVRDRPVPGWRPGADAGAAVESPHVSLICCGSGRSGCC